ncbi:MAG: hypothetical protein NZ602_11990 [Thermoguttaceae bacterium]|nr:hypothetical protein [Thermoguttaceae bacterium]MDW8038632.1 hypothetical protein [Thermoguttaceae bacterium]
MRALIFLGWLVWLVSSSFVLGADSGPPGGNPPKPSPVPATQKALQPIPAEGSGEALCEDMAPLCPQRRIRPYGKLLDKWASYGQFNCECSGSYKYPVPPQYTYHWPGMYSQPTMTQYMSPYRFPPLKLPPKDEDILQPEEEPEENVSERITTRPIRPVSMHRPISR